LPEFFNESERSFFFPIFKNKKERYVNNASGLIETFALSLLECRDMEKPVQKMAIKSRIVSLLTQVYKQHREEEGAAKYVIRDGRIKAVLEYISENLSKPMDMDTLSRFFAISKDYLNILFKKETNNTVTQYIRNQRLNFARREILAGKGAEETAFAVGFNDYSSFFRAYKARFGTAPTVQLDMTGTLEAP
jgi:AraC-like DNA-binding protein